MKQGCLLSPILFNIYINDIVNTVKELDMGLDILGNKIDLLLYADDIAVIAEDEVSMQLKLDVISNWFNTWRIAFNVSKTKVVHFRPKSYNRTSTKFTCNGKCIDVVQGYKYLGLWFDEFLDFNISTKYISASASRALGSIINKCKLVGGINYITFSKLFDACVFPILEYGSEIWGG